MKMECFRSKPPVHLLLLHLFCSRMAIYDRDNGGRFTSEILNFNWFCYFISCPLFKTEVDKSWFCISVNFAKEIITAMASYLFKLNVAR